ncbi:MarR family transcriptional regulator [Pseudomonas syringae pv. japonica str. M301072]|uniref:MarR family transcriptional regulator n=1 Tax=Pseudomonas syringae pv. japonica str. M301072 TaxID=629262 RepID=F3FE84_PSESX|nr:MarR family transcriptional regulator [Pseudomonas syringae pv. japonica str. M301072]
MNIVSGCNSDTSREAGVPSWIAGWPILACLRLAGWSCCTSPRFTEPPTQRELAQSVGVEGPTLARLLDSLEKQGLVQRQAVLEDRRAKKILLSDTALPLIEKIENIANVLRIELFEGVSEEDLRVSMRVHSQILANLERS